MKAQADTTQDLQKDTVQRIQRESGTGGNATLADNRPTTAVQRKLRSGMERSENSTRPIQRKTNELGQKNTTGLPDNLKSGIENLSGRSMDDVTVHYNSSKPAQLQAHAYAQGTDIHLAPGQEKHLPHEAWHVVQQKQGRVRPTMQFKKGVNINDNAGLEKEADVMGRKAANFLGSSKVSKQVKPEGSGAGVVQRVVRREGELDEEDSPFKEALNILKKRTYTYSFWHSLKNPISRQWHKHFNKTAKLLRGNVDVIFSTSAPAGASVNGVTRLECQTAEGAWLDLDRNAGVKDLLRNGEIGAMQIRIEVTPSSYEDGNTIGDILQVLTHELTIHALELSEFIKKYNAREDTKLLTALGQHIYYEELGGNKSYKFLERQIKKSLNNEQIEDFDRRDKDDHAELIKKNYNGKLDAQDKLQLGQELKDSEDIREIFNFSEIEEI